MSERDRGESARLTLAILVSLITWATAFVGARYALRSYAPGPASLARFVVASLGIAAAAAVVRGRWPWPARRDLPRLLLSGTIGNAVYHLALNAGQRRVTAAVASVLVATSPIFTALLARAFLEERIGARGWAGIALAFSGTVMIAGRHGSPLEVEPAAFLVLLAAVAQAVAFILIKPAIGRAHPFTVTAVTVWAGTAVLMAFAPELAATASTAPPAATITLVYLGLCPGLLGALSFAYVLGRLPASRAAPLVYAVPPLTLRPGLPGPRRDDDARRHRGRGRHPRRRGAGRPPRPLDNRRSRGYNGAMSATMTAFALLALAGAAPAPAAKPPLDRAALAARVKEEFLHAWHGYERHAWGHDELRPLSRDGARLARGAAAHDAGRHARHAAPAWA